MTHVTVLVGLPGSGKTELGSRLSGVFIDDLSRTVGERTLAQFFDGLQDDTDYVFADPYLCQPATHAVLAEAISRRFPGCTISWVFFANDPDACLENARRRDDGRLVEGFIRTLTKRYVIPPGADVRPVWRRP
jgi:hypothetical protein